MNRLLLRSGFVFFILLLKLSFQIFSQVNLELWSDVSDKTTFELGQRSSFPVKYRSLKLDLPALMSSLNSSIDEFSPEAFTQGPVIILPMPDGSYSRFRVAKTKVIHDELAVKFPMIQTFIATGIDDEFAVARLDYTQWGFHAMIVSAGEWIIIDPASQANTTDYICYDKEDSHPADVFLCETENLYIKNKKNIIADGSLYRSAGTQLKTYRLAMACTGEYATFHGGTAAGALSAMVTTVNRVNGVYELELAVRMVLIANNNLLVYTNASTDPYTNNSGSTMLGQNISNLSTVIGNANFDFGHVVSTGGGGVAYLGVICNNSLKAGGVTGSGAPVGDGFDIDYVAHEMGHQFGGEHTFNSVTSSCNGNRSDVSAFEPGSGTTIMAYAGICGADNIQPHSDAIFHTHSFDQIQDHIISGTGSTCPVTTSTGNTPPVVTVGANYSIPISTPFILTGSATDVNGDALTYLWEEYDIGPAGSPNSPSGNAPIFRDFVPGTSSSRTFPRIQDLVRNQQTLGEILPSYARSLQFRLTARDNRVGGGGVTYNDVPVTLSVVNTTTPFRVTVPNTALTWFNNTAQTITWDVSSTNASPINCANVNILLSLDSGYTFPYTLISNTPNDGSQSVIIPAVTGNKARVKVESIGNIFFDISNVNFTISSSSPVLTVLTTSPLSSNNLCAGGTVNVAFTGDGPANVGNKFSALLSNASGSFSSPDTIGSLIGTTSGTINATIPAGKPAGTGYRIRVISSNPAITGSDNGSNITIFQTIGTPGVISGLTTVCQGQTGVIYSVPSITNATGYLWSLPSGATITAGSNTNSITVSFSASAVSGSITVQGTNAGCGNGPSSPAKAITVNVLPGVAGTISGTSTVCQNATGISYSVPAISNATGYTWSLPTGASITAGNNTNSITVSFSPLATSGLITVRGTNGCGNGALSASFVLTANSAPAAPVITPSGPVSICSPGSVNLSFTSSPGVTYQWRKNGVNIVGQTGTSYLATSSGNYDVVATFAVTGPQTFSNNTRSFIPDNTCPGGATGITVSGYNGAVNTSGITMTINVTHTWVGDLVIMMETPEGSYLGLSNRTGNANNSGINFTNTVFSDAGSAPIPTSGAPYTGTYKPVATSFSDCFGPTLTSFAAIGSGSINPNGDWVLGVFDRASQDTGSIQNWSITFPATLPNTCTSLSNSVNVSVTSPVTASVSIAANPGNIICSGNAVTFTATPVNGGATPSYQWKNGVTNVGINNSVFVTSSLNNGDVITCIMTNNESCVSGSPDTSNPISMTVVGIPSIFNFSPLGGGIGTVVTINGSGFTGVLSVNFNGTASGFTLINDGTIQAIVPAGAATGLITVTTLCSSTNSSVPFSVIDSVVINTRVLIEGFYTSGGKMRGILSPVHCDTIEVSLASAASPFSIVHAKKGIIDTAGNGSFTFPGTVYSSSFYIVIKHRNSLETWSASPVLLSSVVNSYNFTTTASQAFGNNSISQDGFFVMISGDVNQDDVVDVNDINSIEISSGLFMTGYYPQDLTGDGQVETVDYCIVENNLSKQIMRP